MFMKWKHKNSFYASKDWRSMREYKLHINPTCEMCLSLYERIIPATEIDHIVPLWKAPEMALEPNNLQSLCTRCHILKTKTDTSNYSKANKKKKIKGSILNKRYDI